MKLGLRSKLSLCQFLALLNRDDLILLLGKYGLSTDELENKWGGTSVAAAVKEAILPASVSQLESLVQEIAQTHSSMRTGVSPRYRFDERWDDFILCLKLDGYAKGRDDYDIELDRFVPIEPLIEGADSVEDDLTKELRRSGLSDREEILGRLDRSASAFRDGDFNGCLGNARVALQTLATSIAQAHLASVPGSFDPVKWGQVIAYLNTSGFITQQQERGLAGVYGFISPGSHTPIGFDEQEFARFVTKTLEDPLRRVPLLAVNRAILFQNAVDDIRERRQLRALRRLASPISRRFRMQQYLGNRLAIDPELARSFPSAQTLTMTRQSHSSIKIHSVHPPPSIRSILTKAIDGPILVRRRNRTNRPLHWGIIAPPFSDGAIDGPAPPDGRHAQEFESARFRCDDGRGHPLGWSSAEIEAVPRV